MNHRLKVLQWTHEFAFMRKTSHYRNFHTVVCKSASTLHNAKTKDYYFVIGNTTEEVVSSGLSCPLSVSTIPNSSRRYFSTTSPPPPRDSLSGNNKAYPSIRFYGATCVLTMKPILPTFKSAGQYDNIIDINRRGSMLFEFAPRNQAGIQWNKQIGVALSPEELGLLVQQIPHHNVTFTRLLTAGDGMNGIRYNMVSEEDSVVKTMTVTPSGGGAIHFEIDFKKNGIGGQVPPSGTNEPNFDSAPLDLIVEAGEWEVLMLTAKESIPSLTGWRTLMNIAMNDSLNNR